MSLVSVYAFLGDRKTNTAGRSSSSRGFMAHKSEMGDQRIGFEFSGKNEYRILYVDLMRDIIKQWLS